MSRNAADILGTASCCPATPFLISTLQTLMSSSRNALDDEVSAGNSNPSEDHWTARLALSLLDCSDACRNGSKDEIWAQFPKCLRSIQSDLEYGSKQMMSADFPYDAPYSPEEWAEIVKGCRHLALYTMEQMGGYTTWDLDRCFGSAGAHNFAYM